MAIKKYNPTTPARRGMTTEDYSEITTRKPLKSLLKAKKQNAGRNNSGRITVRHRGGGVKRHYRILTHKLPTGLTLTVREIEYDPNRSARIARVQNSTTFWLTLQCSREKFSKLVRKILKLKLQTECHFQKFLLVH